MTTKENTENPPRFPKRPALVIKWIRFARTLWANFKRALTLPLVFAIYGGTGEGKSSIVETLSDHYPLILDLFGSRDNEGLAWLRSHRGEHALLLHGDSVKVESKYPSMSVSEFMNASWKELFQYKVIISVSAFYSTIEEEWFLMTKIFDKLWNRQSWNPKTLIALAVREAANLIYSRQSIGDSQVQAKNYITYVLRELRHHGFALIFDSVRWYDIDIAIRKIAHYTFLKAQGIEGLPADLQFLYSWFDPYGVMQMGIEKFILYHRKGALAYGSTTCTYWHKQEDENLLTLFEIKVAKAEDKPELGKGGNVGDYEHVKILELRAAQRPDGKRLSMEKIGRLVGRSSKTIHKHISQHNNMISKAGECPYCARVNHPFSKDFVT
jgi:hypothetical protein